jgi:hypothetical protein
MSFAHPSTHLNHVMASRNWVNRASSHADVERTVNALPTPWGQDIQRWDRPWVGDFEILIDASRKFVGSPSLGNYANSEVNRQSFSNRKWVRPLDSQPVRGSDELAKDSLGITLTLKSVLPSLQI